MKLVVAALYDPRDIHRGSGTSHHLCRELERQGHTVIAQTPPEVIRPLITRLLVRLSRSRGLGYRIHQDPFVGQRRGQALTRQLAGLKNFDVLVTNDASIAAYTRCARPIVLYTDAIFPPCYRDNVHPWLEGLAPISVWFSQKVNRLSLRRARRVVVASHWAMELASIYDGLQSPPVVIPYGANLENPPIAQEIAREALTSERIDLLFVGKDWSLKGGDLAVATVTELRRRGHAATLHVVGAQIPEGVDRRWLVDHGSLDKAQPAAQRQLENLYRTSAALLLPSRAEGFGIVFAEAAAYALPSLALRTTGVETSVVDGQSGILFPSQAPLGTFVETIESWLNLPESYLRLCSGARRHFEETVNWSTAVRRLTEIFEEFA